MTSCNRNEKNWENMKTTILAAIAVLSSGLGLASLPVPFRGVVEGYYGRPWGTEGRLSLLEFMGEMKMNVFIYGPKDDPYHHSKWREPYPAREMADFAKLLKAAKANGVNFYWAIHLGGSFRKGSEEDYAALFQKLGWMYDAGFRSFAVFFDDFGSADAEFHAEICNRIVSEFLERRKDVSPLIMCPNVYSGMGHPYQKTLGEKLDRRVQIMWTGRGICSDITAEDVAKITADFRRPPYIWWNWPVNDYCRSRLLLGRTYGLADCQYAGFVANPMENCQASKIALYGVAKWALDPGRFDSAACWEEAFQRLYPDQEIAAAMRIFAEHNSDQGPTVHGYRREESVRDAALCASAREQLQKCGRLTEETASKLTSLFQEVGRASSTLLEKLPKTRYDLGWEIEGWLDAERLLMAQGLKAVELFRGGSDERKILRAIADLRRQAADSVRRHQEKFASATFANDRNWIARPMPSARELSPTVELILTTALKEIYARRMGEPFDSAAGFVAFSLAKSLPSLQVRLDSDRYAGLVRVLEQKQIAPGESFGISIPDNWQTDYFHARLGSDAAAKAGVIELSRDGKRWEKLETVNDGDQMQRRLAVEDGWRHARYRNISGAPVALKIDLFKFDVRGVRQEIDALLERLGDE